MERIYLLIFFAIGSFKSFCQESPLPGDSLRKYSYSLLGFSNSPNADFGTCFFVKQNDNLFLVTAKHTLYNCDTVAKKEYPAFKYGVVFIPDPFNTIQFSVPQTIDTCFGIERDTDLLVLKVDKRLFKDVNTVEKFILPPFKKLGDLEIFGQGMQIDSSYVGFDKQHHIYLPRNTFKVFTSMPIFNNQYIDSIHYIIDIEKLRIDNWLKGFSGSPAFLQDDETKKWRLCGVLVQGLIPASKERNGAILVVKPEYIFKSIKRFQ